MANPNEFEEIIKGLRVMINGFVSKGILPCSEMDIIKGKLPPEKNLMFLSFGIDLKVAITCFPLDPFIPLVKLESKDGILDTNCMNTQIFQDFKIKTEYSSNNASPEKQSSNLPLPDLSEKASPSPKIDLQEILELHE